MRQFRNHFSIANLLFLLAVLATQGCVYGYVYDSNGTSLDAEVIAVAGCYGRGCEHHKTSIYGSDAYRVETDQNGMYVYDAYAMIVDTEDVMVLYPVSDESEEKMLFYFRKDGYKTATLWIAPEYETFTNKEGKKYIFAQLPQVYLCRQEEPDSDGDLICDAAEAKYGTNPNARDTDGDGVSDHDEIFRDQTDPLVAELELVGTWEIIDERNLIATITNTRFHGVFVDGGELALDAEIVEFNNEANYLIWYKEDYDLYAKFSWEGDPLTSDELVLTSYFHGSTIEEARDKTAVVDTYPMHRQ